MRVLMVDDDEDIREVVSVILGQEGHEVELAEDGTAALKRLREGGLPSVILLDLMMPGMDGEAFMNALKGDPLTARIPVVIMSGHKSARRAAAELGAAGCLVKPVDLSDLLATLDRAARAKEARAQSPPHG